VTGTPRFFADPGGLRAWFAEHAATEGELLLGYWKRGSGRPSVTWAESVDEALCVGWIDGVRRRVDDESYTIRFTPRRPGSIWSKVNVARVAALSAEGRMQPTGREVFEARTREGVYAHEQPAATLDGEQEALFRATPEAWDFLRGPAAVVPAASRLVGRLRKAPTHERVAFPS
jgi:uncharacterized protein YdeI (YjbR/CyaY-like superfamily)